MSLPFEDIAFICSPGGGLKYLGVESIIALKGNLDGVYFDSSNHDYDEIPRKLRKDGIEAALCDVRKKTLNGRDLLFTSSKETVVEIMESKICKVWFFSKMDGGISFLNRFSNKVIGYLNNDDIKRVEWELGIDMKAFRYEKASESLSYRLLVNGVDSSITKTPDFKIFERYL